MEFYTDSEVSMDNLMPKLKSAILRQQVAQLIVAVLTILGVTSTIDVSATVEAAFGGATAVIALWTMFTRLFKPTPNLTQTAVKKEEELKSQGKLP